MMTPPPIVAIHRIAALLALAVCLPLAVPVALAQPPADGTAPAPAPTLSAPTKPIEFDIATFKLNKSGDYDRKLGFTGDGFVMQNRAFHDLIRYAFAQGRGGSYRISGQPSWVDDDRYDVQARVAPEDMPEWQQLNAIGQKVALQGFIVQYLKLQYHQDTADHPYYALVVAKGGPKLQEAPDGNPSGPDGKPIPRRTMLWTSPSDLAAYACETQLLADWLTAYTDLPVLNHTDLHKYYTYTLHFDGAPNPSNPSAPDIPFLGLRPQDATPSAFSAVKEIGLELKPAKGPIDGMVIEHIERPPED